MSDATTASGNDTAQLLSQMQAELARTRKENGDNEKPQKILFGTMEVSPEVAGWAGVAWNLGLPRVRSKVEEAIRGDTFEKFVGKFASAERAHATTNLVANTVGWGLIAAKPIEGAVDVVSGYMKQRNELAQQLAPVIQAEGFGIGLNALHRGSLAHNEVIQLELDRLADRAQKRAVKDVIAEAIVVLPNVLLKNRERDEHGRIQVGKPSKKIKTSEDIIAERAALAVKAKENALLNAELDKQARELYQQSYVDAGIQHNEREKSVLIQDILRDLKGAQATQTAAVHTEDKGWLSSEHLKNEWTLAASFLQKEVKSSSMANEDKHAKEKTALSMILKLQDQAERDGKVDFVEGKKLSAYVKDVFETHQKTMGRPAIGERNRPDLEYASEQIAHAIAHGTMHPMALVHLVGDGSIVRNGGKTIATRAEVTQSIATMTSKMPAKYAVDPDKYLSESNYSEAEAKEMVEKLPPAARDMFLSLMPDEVKTRLGVSDAEIAQIHLRAQDQLAQNMQMMVFDIASRGDDELKAQHMTDKEIEFVRKVAKESKAQGVASVLAAVSTHGKFKDGIEFALVNDKSYWQSIAEGKHFGDSYHAANDELYSERVKREATEKLVDERARKLIEEREREKESGGKSHVEKYAAQHAEDKGEKKHADAVRPDASSLASSHVEKVEGKTRHAANDAQPEKDTPPSLASKILQQRQVANGHTQRHA